jgi:glutathione S-transferase
MRQLGIEFEEMLVPFGDPGQPSPFQAFSPSGKVPCLVDGDTVVWESLAIAEYLAERDARVWPADRLARAWARCAASEMHAWFSDLRNVCPMSCGVRMRIDTAPAGLARDVTRLDELWCEGLSRFGGEFLAGGAFTAVDAFFAPVAFRVQSYSLALSAPASVYAARDAAAARRAQGARSRLRLRLVHALGRTAAGRVRARDGSVREDDRARARRDGAIR